MSTSRGQRQPHASGAEHVQLLIEPRYQPGRLASKGWLAAKRGGPSRELDSAVLALWLGDPTTVTRRELAAMIDHTLLKPEATADDVGALCDEAQKLHVCAVCISPTLVAHARHRLRGSQVKVATVIGFPSGAHRSEVKADEAARAAGDGADEADMVISLGLAGAGEWDSVRAEIAAVRGVLTGGQILKVIIEAAVLTPDQIAEACRAAEAAGADFVKSSTGFHPAGGATCEAIRIMAATVGRRLGVKAAGGIRDAQTALALIDAGATRLGMSSTAAVLTELGQSQESA